MGSYIDFKGCLVDGKKKTDLNKKKKSDLNHINLIFLF